MDQDENVEMADSTSNATSKKQLNSKVWEEFTKVGEGIGARAVCNHCNKDYLGDSHYGTTNLSRHLLRCKKRPPEFATKEVQGHTKFDQSVYRVKLAECVFLHGYPFLWSEHRGDRSCHSYLNPSAKSICRNTMKSECLKLNDKLKGEMKSFLGSHPGRVCLTTDLWTSIDTEGFLCLTVHYIDNNWKLSSKILNFRHVPPPHSAIALSDFIHSLLKEWGIDKKILSITMDNASNMDNMQENLCYRLNNSLVCGGQFFHIRCCAHILNLVVQAGLKCIKDEVHSVRESVKYVKGSEARKIKFRECVQLAGINSKKGLWLDVTTRWNSTYQMLDRAILFRKAFKKLSAMDIHYLHLPSPDEWSKMEKIQEVLKPFQTISSLFSGSDYPTANLYFLNVWKIQKGLMKLAESLDPKLKEMTVAMREKFDKYWRDYSHVLSFAVILDPCYKLSSLRSRYKSLNDEGKAAIVKSQFENMFKEYSNELVGCTQGSAAINSVQQPTAATGEDSCSDCSSSDDEGSSSGKTEFDIYLAEAKVDKSSDFDILDYWKVNQARFPVLSAMARDILCIPITTVASESTFSIGGRILNKYRTRLLPENSEALITTRSWLYGYEAYGPDEPEGDTLVGGVEINIAEQPQPSSSYV